MDGPTQLANVVLTKKLCSSKARDCIRRLRRTQADRCYIHRCPFQNKFYTDFWRTRANWNRKYVTRWQTVHTETQARRKLAVLRLKKGRFGVSGWYRGVTRSTAR